MRKKKKKERKTKRRDKDKGRRRCDWEEYERGIEDKDLRKTVTEATRTTIKGTIPTKTATTWIRTIVPQQQPLLVENDTEVGDNLA